MDESGGGGGRELELGFGSINMEYIFFWDLDVLGEKKKRISSKSQ
jgi:hypothetical protein